ncbi:MAG: hypothetical protein ABIS86_17750 [Streptosporangiaceae bacterium]
MTLGPRLGQINEQDISWVTAGDVGLHLLRVAPDDRFKAGFPLPTSQHTGTVGLGEATGITRPRGILR